MKIILLLYRESFKKLFKQVLKDKYSYEYKIDFNVLYLKIINIDFRRRSDYFESLFQDDYFIVVGCV